MWSEAASSMSWIGGDVRGGNQPARALAGCDSGSGGFGGDDEKRVRRRPDEIDNFGLAWTVVARRAFRRKTKGT